MVMIGTSGFSFRDWKGPVYPASLPAGKMLSYYALELGFDTVEINSTYYSIPRPSQMEAMSRKTPDNFRFTVKAHRSMTHDPFDRRIEKESHHDTRDNFKLFELSVEPLKNSGKLGAILLQFPVFFYPSRANRQYILDSRDMLGNIPVAVEFRNNSWATEETFSFLRDNGLDYCAVDEPKLPRLMPFINEVTAKTGYMRFHGRNTNWFNAPISTRYDYLYSESEPEEFVPEVNKMSGLSEKVFVFFNNCNMGSAAINALRFREMMGLSPGGGGRLFE